MFERGARRENQSGVSALTMADKAGAGSWSWWLFQTCLGSSLHKVLLEKRVTV